MTKPHDNAFPSMVGDPGLTKHELFAAMAMQALLSHPTRSNLLCEDAAIAVDCATALIQALSSRPTDWEDASHE